MESTDKKPLVDVDALSMCLDEQHQTHARHTLDMAVRRITTHLMPEKYRTDVFEDIIDLALGEIRGGPIPERARTPIQAYEFVYGVVKRMLEIKGVLYKVKIGSAPKLLDLIEQLKRGESLSITPNGPRVDFTLSREMDRGEGVTKTLKSTSSMPPDHHCDLERIVDVVVFLQDRLDKSEESAF